MEGNVKKNIVNNIYSNIRLNLGIKSFFESIFNQTQHFFDQEIIYPLSKKLMPTYLIKSLVIMEQTINGVIKKAKI